ncbi:glycosyltransferase domain-containing protein [uncultured Tateyamaria sp.]|uniref:glycosyltransferase domain-containing protein n=1 Tax=uncultured Tateyamaria sp. TaxID=455651 RepID=UPI0026329C4C|nr:glycosyltransferase domain-containing protein [uncultured Tateyamaria sp.]
MHLNSDEEVCASSTRSSRLAKILPHRFLERYDSSIYIDANLKVKGPLQSLFAQLDKASLIFFEHPEGRRDIYSEVDICIKINKDDPEKLLEQAARYKALGFDGRASDGDAPIPAGMVILRRHNEPTVVEAMEKWWSEYLAGSLRDQISLPFALRQTGAEFNLIQDNVRDNEWFEWQPHYKKCALKKLSAAYERADAIILHAPGAEQVAKHLVSDKLLPGSRRHVRLLNSIFRPPKNSILFDTNTFGVSPHGTSGIEMAAANCLLRKPVALLCDDPELHEKHAIENAISTGAIFQNTSEVLISNAYGTSRRILFEESVKAFLTTHPGPKAILRAEDIECGNLTELLTWFHAQKRATWPVRVRSMIRSKSSSIH